MTDQARPDSTGPTEHPTRAQRTILVPLEFVTDETWVALRRLSYLCAAFGNHLLSSSYCAVKGLTGLTPYTDAKGELSSAVRDAVSRECMGLWRRLGKKILRGEQTLARFAADRALVVRDRGVRLLQEGAGYTVTLRVHPRNAGEVTRLPVWMPAPKRDAWLAATLDALARGEFEITKGTLQFERPGRKLYIRITYVRSTGGTLSPASHDAGTRGALQAPHPVSGAPGTFAVVEYRPEPEPGLLFVRCDGRTLSLHDAVYRLSQMKTHFAGIHARLRRCLGKRGRRRDHRRALVQAGSFERWAEGPLHQLSRQIVDWATEQRAIGVHWTIETPNVQKPSNSLERLPWYRLKEFVTYKAADAGLRFSQTAPAAPQAFGLRDGEEAHDKQATTSQRVRKRVQK